MDTSAAWRWIDGDDFFGRDRDAGLRRWPQPGIFCEITSAAIGAGGAGGAGGDDLDAIRAKRDTW
jgi:hypothetical protein